MDQPTDGLTSGWTMFISYTDAIDASVNNEFLTDFAIFTKALQMDGRTIGRMDQLQSYPLIEMQKPHLKIL